MKKSDRLKIVILGITGLLILIGTGIFIFIGQSICTMAGVGLFVIVCLGMVAVAGKKDDQTERTYLYCVTYRPDRNNRTA